MPTQINRKRLIEAVDLTIEQDRKNWEAARQRVRDAIAEQRTDWIAEWNPRWDDAISKIQDAIADDQPITRELLPGRPFDSVPTFSDNGRVRIDQRWYDEPRESDVFVPNKGLVALKNACMVVDDETITPNALDALGVTKAALREAVQMLGYMEQKDKAKQAGEENA